MSQELAKEVAAKDGITEGLICVLGAVEPCTSFKTRINEQTYRLKIVPYLLAIPPPDDLFGFVVVGHGEMVPFRIANSGSYMPIECPLAHIILWPVIIQNSAGILEFVFAPETRLKMATIVFKLNGIIVICQDSGRIHPPHQRLG